MVIEKINYKNIKISKITKQKAKINVIRLKLYSEETLPFH